MSNNIQLFSMNRCTAVEVLDEKTLRSTCRLQDTFTTASVEILVRLPNLDIIDISGQFRHEWHEVPDIAGVLQKLIGTRVGAGMLKIIKGLVGGGEELSQLTYMVEECCHGVILSLTRDILQKAPVDDEGKIEFFANMVKDNIRLYNRCAAFAPGTRLTENIEPPA
jgi:hypothetical protein